MDSDVLVSLAYVGVTVLLPMLPAALFFNLLPRSSGRVQSNEARDSNDEDQRQQGVEPKKGGAQASDQRGSSDAVWGRLHGLRFKLTGAFAGYFLVFFLIFSATHSQMVPPPIQPEESWQVVGNIDGASETTDGNQIIPDTDPPAGSVKGSNIFEVDFRKSASDPFPNVTIAAKPDGKFKRITICLDDKYKDLPQDYHGEKDSKHHIIKIKEPIKIVRVPLVTETGLQPLTPLSK